MVNFVIKINLIRVVEGELPNYKNDFQWFLSITEKHIINKAFFLPFKRFPRVSLFLSIVMGLLLSFKQAHAQGGPPLEVIERFGGGQAGQHRQNLMPDRQKIYVPEESPSPRQPRQAPTQPPLRVQPKPYNQPPSQQPEMNQQQPTRFGQPMIQPQFPNQYQQPPPQQVEQYPQSPLQQPGMTQQQSAPYGQPVVQSPPGQLQHSPLNPGQSIIQQFKSKRTHLPGSVRESMPTIVSGKIGIEGVKSLLKELLKAREGMEWKLKAFIGKPPQKIYLTNLKWMVKPDDGTFEIDDSNPKVTLVRLKSKKNIWADPKLRMITKEYVFHVEARGESGGKVTSIESILFAQCSFPVEFYTADKKPFDYPDGYQYRFSLQRQNGEFVDYKEYKELGKLTVNLPEGFKKRVIFHWDENTEGKSTLIKLEIIRNGKLILEKTQEMTSTCRNTTGYDDVTTNFTKRTLPPLHAIPETKQPSSTWSRPILKKLENTDTVTKRTPLPPQPIPETKHPSFSWSWPILKKLEDTDLFQVVLNDFKIINNKSPNILNTQNYFLEGRFYNQGLEINDVFNAPFQANQLSLVTKILPPHVENRRILLRGKSDDFSRMGYVLESNPDKWYDGYLKLFVVFDSIPMETIYESPSYPCRYKYHEGIFSKEYFVEMVGGKPAKAKRFPPPTLDKIPEKHAPVADEKPEKG